MKISIFGLGYVGCISLGCLAQNGHIVIGCDINPDKVHLINKGIPTVIEKEIDRIIRENHNKNRISATSEHRKAVLDSDISIICVGTPSSEDGALNLKYIYRIASQIGEALKEKSGFHTILIRSTVEPGTNKKVTAIISKNSGKKNITDFAVVSNPEFLREGSAVYDYYHPSYTLIASESKMGIEIAKKIYKTIDAPIIETDVREAEILKYINNSFHALKITFANEVGNICKKLDIDSHKVMDVFCKDTKLNISPYYLKPGFAYGGSCLPKDLKGLRKLGKDEDLSTHLLDAIDESNKYQIDIAAKMIRETGKETVSINTKRGFAGMAHSIFL